MTKKIDNQGSAKPNPTSGEANTAASKPTYVPPGHKMQSGGLGDANHPGETHFEVPQKDNGTSDYVEP